MESCEHHYRTLLRALDRQGKHVPHWLSILPKECKTPAIDYLLQREAWIEIPNVLFQELSWRGRLGHVWERINAHPTLLLLGTIWYVMRK